MTTPEDIAEIPDAPPDGHLFDPPPPGGDIYHGEGFTAVGKIDLTDPRVQPFPHPCRDCGRPYLNGEHVGFTVARVPTADDPAEERTVWSGCVDCWEKRTRNESTFVAPAYVHRLLDAFLTGSPLVVDEGMEVHADIAARLEQEGVRHRLRATGAGRRDRRSALRKADKARKRGATIPGYVSKPDLAPGEHRLADPAVQRSVARAVHADGTIHDEVAGIAVEARLPVDGSATTRGVS
jgi:hypothetical protein